MFKKLIITAALSLCVVSVAQATVTCSTDSWGNTRCSGTTQNGGQVNTTSTTDSWGNTRTSGTVNGQPYTQNCTTDSWGNTRCN